MHRTVFGGVRPLAVRERRHHPGDVHGRTTEAGRFATHGQSADHAAEDGPVHGGPRRFSAGPCACVVIGGGSVTLVLTSERCENASCGIFRQVGVRPEMHRVVVAKGVEAPRLAFEQIAGRMLEARSPGITCVDMTQFPFRRRRVPMHPFERDAVL